MRELLLINVNQLRFLLYTQGVYELLSSQPLSKDRGVVLYIAVANHVRADRDRGQTERWNVILQE